MRVKHKVNVRIGDDANMTDLLFAPDDSAAEVSLDNFERQSSGRFKIEAAANEDLPTGDVTAIQGAYIKVNSDCTLKINGSADAILLKKGPLATHAKFFIEATITEMNIENTNAADLEGIVCVWGDVAS